MDYDIIIVGAGMGGCAVAYVLADLGLRILILEKGLPQSDWDQKYSNDYAEKFVESVEEQNYARNSQKNLKHREDVYSKAARSTYKVNSWIPVLGAGEGGGTAVYGAVLLRYPPFDFKRWPFSYEIIKPYYELAEKLFQPYGTNDPLSPERQFLNEPKPLSKAGEEIRNFLIQQGMHPFRTPIGYSAKENCQSCFGHFCSFDCKKSGANVFLKPAQKAGNIEIEYSSSVESLIEKDGKVTGIIFSKNNERKEVRAKYFFLAAGALVSPVILMKSKSEKFPNGIGNNHDLVGRNLMRHLIDFYFVKTPSSPKAQGHLNELSMSDFYAENASRWGILSMVPELMPPKLMAREFCEQLGAKYHIPFYRKWFLPIVSAILNLQMKDRVLLTAINEDSASKENRVTAKSNLDSIEVQYQITKEDLKRLKASRSYYKRLFKPLGGNLIKVAEDNSFLAHACGTCRMAPSAESGVVNPNGQVFGVENLYIADASIFPTSSGVNPSLTVAACALKIATEFKQKFEESRVGKI